MDSLRLSVKRLKEGVPLCVFAEGGISRLGVLLPFYEGIRSAGETGKGSSTSSSGWRMGFRIQHEAVSFFGRCPFPFRIESPFGSVLQFKPKKRMSYGLGMKLYVNLGRLSFCDRIKVGKEAKNELEKTTIFAKPEWCSFPIRGW